MDELLDRVERLDRSECLDRCGHLDRGECLDRVIILIGVIA